MLFLIFWRFWYQRAQSISKNKKDVTITSSKSITVLTVDKSFWQTLYMNAKLFSGPKKFSDYQEMNVWHKMNSPT